MDKSGHEKGTPDTAVQGAVARDAVKKRTVGDYAREAFFGLLYSLWGYLLGRCALPFGAKPFGIALLCASENRTLWVYVGVCLSAIGSPHAIMRVVAYSAVLLIRLLVRLVFDTPWEAAEGGEIGEKTFFEARHLFFNEHLSLRMCTSCVGALSVGVYLLVRGGFLYYDLYGALISLFTAPVAVALLVGLFGERRKKEIYRTVSFISLAAALVYATRTLELYHISAAAFGALFASLYLVRREGTVKGVLAGAVLGLCYSPALSPLFAFGALCGGIVFPTSVTLGTVTVFTVGTAWALYTKGIGALNGLLPAILAASVLYAVTDKLFISEKKKNTLGETEDTTKISESEAARTEDGVALLDASSLNGIRLCDTETRVGAVRESFSALSGVFESMSDMLRRPCEEDLRRICDNAFDSSCTGCAQKEICWDENYRQTDSEISVLCASLHRDGSVSAVDASAALKARCARLPDILDEINHNASAHASRILQYDKTEIFANDYSVMADILSEAMGNNEAEYELDALLSQKLCDALSRSETSVKIKAAAVFGKRKKRVALALYGDESFLAAREEILRIAGEICSCRMTFEKEEKLGDGTLSVLLSASRKLRVRCVSRTLRSDGEEEYCGDTVGTFEDGDDRFYAFISDGMGAGYDAAVTSGICALFLKKMLSAGNGCESALRIINGFLRNKGNGSLHECSATVDLWELDLLSGKASFCKCGAAPTYVLRDGGLFKIRSKTLPIGILREPDTKRIGFDVDAGDVIVMVSDGITQGKEECLWLYDLLRGNISSLGIERTAELVMNYAKKEGSTDDMSILILKVENQ